MTSKKNSSPASKEADTALSPVESEHAHPGRIFDSTYRQLTQQGEDLSFARLHAAMHAASTLVFALIDQIEDFVAGKITAQQIQSQAKELGHAWNRELRAVFGSFKQED